VEGDRVVFGPNERAYAWIRIARINARSSATEQSAASMHTVALDTMCTTSSPCEDALNKTRSGDVGLSLKAHRPMPDKAHDAAHPCGAGIGITLIGLSPLIVATDNRR